MSLEQWTDTAGGWSPSETGTDRNERCLSRARNSKSLTRTSGGTANA